MPLFNPSSSFEKLREVAIQERIRNQLERRHMVPLATALTMAANAAATAYEESGTMSAVDRAMQPASERLRLALRRVYFDSINTMKTHAIGELPQKTLTVLIERKDLTGAIDAVLTAWVRTRTAEKVKRITRTTRNTIKAVIADAVAQGLGQSEVASSIATKLKSFTRARAKMIARTETHSAMQSSSLTVAENTPSQLPRQKEWVSVEDDRTRHTHAEADGQKVGLSETFAVNGSAMRYPGDPSAPASEVINCRCVMVYQEGGN